MHTAESSDRRGLILDIVFIDVLADLRGEENVQEASGTAITVLKTNQPNNPLLKALKTRRSM